MAKKPNRPSICKPPEITKTPVVPSAPLTTKTPLVQCMPPSIGSAVEQLDFTVAWHLEKALALATDADNEPIRSNLLLLRSHLLALRQRLSKVTSRQ